MINPEMTVENLNAASKNSMTGFLGIDFVEIADNYVKATMPVAPKTMQPFGLLHGGASAVLAETLGSVGALNSIDASSHICVGLEINTNHIRSASSGIVVGVATPVHVGSKTQVWEVRITNESEELISLSRITLMILKKKTSDEG